MPEERGDELSACGSRSVGQPLLRQVAASSDRFWTGEAFGLSITSAVSLPGLEPGERRHGPRPLTIELVPQLEPGDGERVLEWRDADEVPALVIDADERGFHFDVRGSGRYELSADGRRALCAPTPGAGFSWRRYLMGQVIPFAALLQGLEVFHASAVELGGSVVALAAGSGLGKSTLALNLHLGGAGFVTDDVLAVELHGDEPLVHSGLGAAKVRRAASELVDPARLGAPANSDAHESRYLIEPVPGPLPLGTFCALERSPDGVVRVAEAEAAPLRLIASTFNLVVATPARLDAQLAVCAAIARRARVLTVAVPDRPDKRSAAQLRDLLMRARVAA
jgi:hypothetical protein